MADEDTPPFDEIKADLAKYLKYDKTHEIVTLDDPEDVDVTYGRWSTVDLDKAEPTDWLLVPYASGSDYSGNLVEVSNKDYWLEKYGHLGGDEEHVRRVYGGHGTFGVLHRLDALTEDALDDLKRLSNYPLLDEDLNSQLEMEAQNEAWKAWAEKDFREQLVIELSAEIEQTMLDAGYTGRDWPIDADEVAEQTVDAISPNDLSEMFYTTGDRIGEYWENEQGSSVYIDVKKIAANINDVEMQLLLRKALKSVKIPVDVLPPEVDPRQQRLPGVAERRRGRRP